MVRIHDCEEPSLSDLKGKCEALLNKCIECGIPAEQFLNEKMMELAERKRILITTNRKWFNDNRRRYLSYAASILRRPLSDAEKNSPEVELLQIMRRRLNPESRENLHADIQLKRRLLKESNDRCALCGLPLSTNNIRIDHIIPLAEGGSNHSLNLQALCEECNGGKSDYFLETAEAAARPWYEARKSLLNGNVTLTRKKRFCVLVRDNSTCRKCRRTAKEAHLKVRLRVPKSDGGQMVYDNLITVCETCYSA